MMPSKPASPANKKPGQQAFRSGASAAQQTIAVIGDVWTLRILRTVFRGKRRHGDFVAEFGVSRAVLSDRLNKLVAHEVLLRDVRDGGHPEYRLTERGLDLWPLFLAMWCWETDWGTMKEPDTWAPDRPRSQVVHTVCDHAMQPELCCQACLKTVVPFETAAAEPAGRSPAADAASAAAAGEGAAADTDARAATLAGAKESGAGAASSSFRRARQAGAGATPHTAQKLVRVIGDRWNSAVVAAAFRGTRQFSKFELDLGIGPAQLSDRLAELQQLGIVRPHVYARTRQEYRLTKAGIALFPITLEMVRWGNRWLWPGSDSFSVRHLPCGAPLVARWHCGHCRDELQRDTLRFS